MKNADFLPITKEEIKRRGWETPDIILVSGDAYVDHPSFAAAVIGRILENEGYKVAILAQPDWRKPEEFAKLGRPRLFFGITAGNMDSMLNLYTAGKRLRNADAYSPGGKTGMRPPRATIVYANCIRQIFKDMPIVIGGIEASLRRLAHFDYWENRIRRSILLDSRADILVYGMGEPQIIEIAKRLSSGESINSVNDIRGTVICRNDITSIKSYQKLPSYEDVVISKNKFSEAFKLFYFEQDPAIGKTLVQQSGDRFVIQYPPPPPLSAQQLDNIYDLPYTRRAHPAYEKYGGVPALKTVQWSITSHRGCLATCSFCTLSLHQGKIIQNRSEESILREAKHFTKMPDFKGIISDLGGPTANMYGFTCHKQTKFGSCQNKDCLLPQPCANLESTHTRHLNILRKVRALPGIKKVCVSTGIRYDLVLYDKKSGYLKEICEHHVSGQLKVAPEHTSPRILRIMNKPPFEVFEKFKEEYTKINRKLGKKQYLVEYFISGHPGCTVKDMQELARYMRASGHFYEQVQEFTPTPMSLSTCIYYTGIHPLTGEKVYVPRSHKERQIQRTLLQPKN
ncbi:MAG: YgiQ family radical SAM protein [Candidatus Omnitrophica bacterium]|nr:YgiQ family radical SAM protein [Candidatus Omnitrophota bacterium]